LGIGARATDCHSRITEVGNFVERMVKPTMARRGRA